MRLRTLAFVQAGSRAARAPFGVEVCEVHECMDISPKSPFISAIKFITKKMAVAGVFAA